MAKLHHLTTSSQQLPVPCLAAYLCISEMNPDRAFWVLFLNLTGKSHVPAFRVYLLEIPIETIRQLTWKAYSNDTQVPFGTVFEVAVLFQIPSEQRQ